MNTVKTIVATVLLASSIASAHAGELISGDVFSNFQPTEQWHLVKKVGLDKADPKRLHGQANASGKILLNASERVKGLPYLLTEESFGDVEVGLEYMIPQGSNAGVYVMGRYEVQIFDSYGVEELKSSDMGAIYERYIEKHEVQPGQVSGGYEGFAPRVNAAKAPGKWQRLDIKFRAPRFDENGNKTENARFISVRLNGKLVQENVEVTGPTRSNPLKGEAAVGPISIQGDHGPVAIRSFTVRALSD